MKRTILLILCITFVSFDCFSQDPKQLKTIKQKDKDGNPVFFTDSLSRNSSNQSTSNKDIKNLEAKIEDYRIVSYTRDSTFVDTTLTIKKDYKYNYLREDNFNLMPFANLGQTYNTLRYDFTNSETLPAFGARARHFNYMEVEDINYFRVPTPLTELFYKTAFEQGQLVDAFFTVNTSDRFNFSIAYKGLRSLGKYQNALTSTGNLRFTTNYRSKSGKYTLRAHAVMQDLLNQENGGIIDDEIPFFESGEEEFLDRSIFQVNFEDAENILKGRRYYLDHGYALVSKKDSISYSELRIGNTIRFEDKFYQFEQGRQNDFFGDAFETSNLKDKVTLEDFGTSIYTTYDSKKIGHLRISLDYTNLNYGYYKVIVLDEQTIPNRIKDEIITVGGQYQNSFGSLDIIGNLRTNITGELNGSSFMGKAKYNLDEDNSLSVSINSSSRAPNYNFLLYQSDYINYNWYNDFRNVTTQVLSSSISLGKILNLDIDYTSIGNYTYFQKTQENSIKPFQTDQTINYLNLKFGKEFKYRKFTLANKIAYQNVINGNNILNVPEVITRNTLYYTSHFFKKALFLQTGVTLKYFTKYNMNAYDPLLAEFYVQNDQEFGGFPMLDFFINAKVRQTRIYLKAEHFNSPFTGYNYYSAPNNPYRDFTVRFGLVWNFFL